MILKENEAPRCVAVLVEDEWLVRMEVAEALASAGFTVLEAAGGDDALTYLGQHDAIHLLVTDIRMVGVMTGWEVADAFRMARPGIGVIYASANSPLEARQVPGSVFFGKPAPMGELIETCRSLCPSSQT